MFVELEGLGGGLLNLGSGLLDIKDLKTIKCVSFEGQWFCSINGEGS